MRLFARGDELSQAARDKKLKCEYKQLNELTEYLYWTNVGRVGALHFENALRQKRMAQQMRASIPGEVSTERAAKMIRQAHEKQDKADAARLAARAKKKARQNGNRGRGNRRGACRPSAAAL